MVGEGLRTALTAACFAFMSGLFSAPMAYVTVQELHHEEELVQQQTAQVQDMEQQLTDLRVAESKRDSVRETPNPLEALARYCVGVPKDRNGKHTPLLCPAEGEVCDEPSRARCIEEHQAYYF